METLSFPRYNVAEIVTHIRNKILTGADGKNLSKNDLYPNPKVRRGVSACGRRSLETKEAAGSPGRRRADTPLLAAAGRVGPSAFPLGVQAGTRLLSSKKASELSRVHMDEASG